MVPEYRLKDALPVLQVQGQSMANKVNGTGLESKVLVDGIHGGSGHVHALVSRRVLLFVGLDIFKELLSSALLEESHQGRANGLHLGSGNLGNLALTVNIRSSDLLELEVAGDVGVGEDLDELAVGHHELGDQVDIVVTVASQLGRRGSTIAELSVKLKGNFITMLPLLECKSVLTRVSNFIKNPTERESC
jgi:hypothetical protein